MGTLSQLLSLTNASPLVSLVYLLTVSNTVIGWTIYKNATKNDTML